MSSLKVIALISGGKDSLYSILHCLANGHDVVALGNLYPPSIASSELQNHEGDDINSFMYQTVGHSIIPLYEEALGIPLYREQILGSALNADKDYAPAVSGNAGHETSILTPRIAPSESQEQDETESLIPLLNKIIRSHPEATAVSTGAILSTYQRTRIESVAIRLGLVPLSYLWQYTALPPYSQSALLEDMAAVGQDARIIKVASGGLDSSFLWENVTDARTVGRLKRAMARFDARDGAVVGEGGEFETLAVDGPVGLWRKRIEVEVQGNVVGEGGTAIARLGKARAVDKKEGEANKNVLEILRRPQLLDKEFEMLMRMLGEVDFNTSSKGLSPDHLNRFNAPLNSPADLPAHLPVDLLTYHLATSGPLLTISNLTSPSSGPIPSIQLTSILSQLTTLLRSYSLTSASIISSTLLLRSMSSFTTLNPIYGAYFPNPIPPARVTVACGEALPDSVEVMLSVVVDKEGNGKRKRGLHVQSRSYWAPANIGPYSQAVAVPLERTDEIHGKARNRTHMVFMAGQIPLVPTTMQIVRLEDIRICEPDCSMHAKMKEFKLQTTLALQHLWRIGRATDVRWWTSGVAFISNCGKEEAEQRALVAMKAWRAIHEALMSMDDGEGGKGEDEEMDIWDMKYRAGAGDGLDQFEFDSRPALPDYSTLELEEADFEPIPPCFVIQVDSLPRDADIEWTSLGLTLNDSKISLQTTTSLPSVHITRIHNTSTSFICASISNADELNHMDSLIQASHSWEVVNHLIQTHPNIDPGALEDFISQLSDRDRGTAQIKANQDSLLYTTKLTRAQASELSHHPVVKHIAEGDGDDESDLNRYTYAGDDQKHVLQQPSREVNNHYTVYTTQVRALPREWQEGTGVNVTVVPCKRVWSDGGVEMAAVVLGRRVAGS